MTHPPVRTLAKTQFPLGHKFENDGAHQQDILVGTDEKPLQAPGNEITGGVRIPSSLDFLTVSKTAPAFSCSKSWSSALTNILFG